MVEAKREREAESGLYTKVKAASARLESLDFFTREPSTSGPFELTHTVGVRILSFDGRSIEYSASVTVRIENVIALCSTWHARMKFSEEVARIELEKEPGVLVSSLADRVALTFAHVTRESLDGPAIIINPAWLEDAEHIKLEWAGSKDPRDANESSGDQGEQ